MTPERWRQVTEIFHAARARNSSDLADYLDRACAGDRALRSEVDAMLAAHGEPEMIPERPLSDGVTPRLESGTLVGPYRIVQLIGAGGMGEVFRAHDTKLHRDVALKVLPEAFGDDPTRLARLTREAHVLASLNHPNIAAIYGLEESHGLHALVLELVDGPTLGDRIARGALPLNEALTIAIQIARGLDAAHRAGVVHRDLKPGNIMITKTGAKLLDFGLAKATAVVATGARPSMLPTTPPTLTAQGTIVGTFQYMAPEQLEGTDADARTDIFAFGAVLYEMLTGKKAFDGKSQASLIAAILEHHPAPPSAERPLTPPAVDHVVATCLAKDPDERWQSAGDLERELTWAAARTETRPDMASSAGRGLRRVLTWAGAALLTGFLAGGALTFVALRRQANLPGQPLGPIRALVDVAPAEWLQADLLDQSALGGGGRPRRTVMAISPDGRSLVFGATREGRQQLYIRSLADLTAKPISGTEGAHSPFYSPDGEWIGFWASNSLQKVAARAESPPVKICDTPLIYGASWSPDDTVIFSQVSGGLWRVSAKGGMPQTITQLDTERGEYSHRLPHVIPGGRAVLFTITDSQFPRWNNTLIAVQSLATGQRKVLIEGGADAHYVPTGHLVYVRSGTLMAVPFNLERLEVAGGPAALVSDLMQATNVRAFQSNAGAGQFSLSASGALIYLPGGVAPELERSLIWVDRNGTEHPLPVPLRAYQAPRLSPDGTRLAFHTRAADTDVWVYDLTRGTFSRLTTNGQSEMSIWTPDGKRLAFLSRSAGLYDVGWQPADTSTAFERLTSGDTPRHPHSWTPDGSTIAGIEFNEATGYDVWALRVGGDGPQPVLRLPSSQSAPEFSPDGRWLAYFSNESGRPEVYVQPYPGPGARTVVSTEGGREPAWSRDGRELFYTALPSADGPIKMMAVAVSSTTEFRAGAPRTLFEGRYVWSNPIRMYDVAPDGKRFLMVQDVERPPMKLTHMVMVQNWLDELKARVPTR